MIAGEAWERIDELFDAALDLPDEARSRWLDAVCANEPDVRQQVERLLELSGSDDPRLHPETIETLVKLLKLGGEPPSAPSRKPRAGSR